MFNAAPYICGNIKHFVFLVIFFSISSIFIFQVFKSTSTKIGVAELLIIAVALEIIVNEGIITSSFFFKHKALIAISNAAVPLLTAQPNLRSRNFEILFSNSLTLGPSDDIQPDLIDLDTAIASLLLINGVFTGIKFLYFSNLTFYKFFIFALDIGSLFNFNNFSLFKNFKPMATLK